MGRVRHPCLIPDHTWKSLSLSFEDEIRCGFFIYGLYCVEVCILETYFVEGFDHEWMLHIVKCFNKTELTHYKLLLSQFCFVKACTMKIFNHIKYPIIILHWIPIYPPSRFYISIFSKCFTTYLSIFLSTQFLWYNSNDVADIITPYS